MLKNSSPETSINNKLLLSELRRKEGKISLSLHQNSLNYEVYWGIYTKKWEFSLKDDFGVFHHIPQGSMKIPKQLKFVQKSNIQCYFEGFHHLSRYLKRLMTVKHFGLRIGYELKKKELHHLNESLKKVSLLESFHFCFHHWDHARDKHLDQLSKSFRIYNLLKAIVLDFSHCKKITDQGIYYLCQNLKNLTRLENICLVFWGCRFITDEGLATIQTFLNRLENLQVVKLHFRYCPKISLHTVENIIQDFKTSKIIIDFSYSWKIIVKSATQESHNFILFHIDFWAIERKNEFKNLEKILVRRVALQNLNLEFENFGSLHKSELKQICHTLKFLPLLKNLSFRFTSPGIDDEVLKEISHSLKRLQQLQYLSLGFMTRTLISIKGLESLLKNMKKLVNLENLELRLSDCSEITDKELEMISKNLGKIVSLQKMSLDFSDCHMMSSSELEKMAPRLKSLVILQEITLKFAQSENVEQENIVKILEDHPSLERVNLDFGQGLQTFRRDEGQVQKKRGSGGLFSLFDAVVRSIFTFKTDKSHQSFKKI